MKQCAEHFTTLGVIKYISGHVTSALGSSGTMSMAMSSLFVCLFVCLSVCLSVCLTFSSAML